MRLPRLRSILLAPPFLFALFYLGLVVVVLLGELWERSGGDDRGPGRGIESPICGRLLDKCL